MVVCGWGDWENAMLWISLSCTAVNPVVAFASSSLGAGAGYRRSHARSVLDLVRHTMLRHAGSGYHRARPAGALLPQAVCCVQKPVW